jgi:hypothetical protein
MIDLTKRRVAIVGSARYPQMHLVTKIVGLLPQSVTVLCDTEDVIGMTVASAARSRGLQVRSVSLEKRFGKRAIPILNDRIVGGSDYLVSFWDGVSDGVRKCINLASKRGRLLVVYDTDGSIRVAPLDWRVELVTPEEVAAWRDREPLCAVG